MEEYHYKKRQTVGCKLFTHFIHYFCTCCPHSLLIPVHIHLYKIWHCSHIWLNTEYAFPCILSVLIHSLLADSQITVSLINYNTIHSILPHLYEYIYCCSHITILLYYMPHHLLIQMYINNHTHTVCINVNIPWTWAVYARGKIRLFTLLLGCVWRPNCVPSDLESTAGGNGLLHQEFRSLRECG